MCCCEISTRSVKILCHVLWRQEGSIDSVLFLAFPGLSGTSVAKRPEKAGHSQVFGLRERPN